MSNKKYQPLTIPRLSWTTNTLSNNFGELVAHPLEPGFGITLGNALRRVLLGGIEGSAVTSVIISGVNNEFSTLKGVVEDAMQVLLNIKELVIKNNTGQPGKMVLIVNEESVAKAENIIVDEHLEIVNKDHIIAHVAQGGNLYIEFFVEQGRGYQPAQWPIGTALSEDNKIYLDSMFSPIRQVTFDVEKTRVGKNIDYDKLILTVHTDGSQTPVEAVNYAVSILRTQLEHFLLDTEIPFNDISEVPEVEVPAAEAKVEESTLKGIPVELLLKPIEELELSVRAHNCLIQAGVKRIIDLINMPEDDILKIKNFGRKSLNEVKDALKSFGLHFGMEIKESDVKKILDSKDGDHGL